MRRPVVVTANLPRALDTTLRRRGTGGVIEVRVGVWRIDVEAPRDPATGRRRRRSRLIYGIRDDAERALEEYGPALSSGTLESGRADESRAGFVERMPDAAGPDAEGLGGTLYPGARRLHGGRRKPVVPHASPIGFVDRKGPAGCCPSATVCGASAPRHRGTLRLASVDGPLASSMALVRMRSSPSRT